MLRPRAGWYALHGAGWAVADTGVRNVALGRIVGLYGVRGWVKVYSDTDPPEKIIDYSPWQLCIEGRWTEVEVVEGRRHGKGLIARLQGLDDREEARRLLGVEIAIARSQMPDLEPGEYYWVDLIGLQAVNTEGVRLGRVQGLMETGSNDVLLVKGEREHLIPYLPGDVVRDVDLEGGVIRVDWEPDF